MCPPAEFDVTYSINPWMDPSEPVDPRLAYLQWQRIHDLHVELGHTVDLIEPLPGLPDMVFAANGATVHDGRVLVARFRYDERAAEAPAYLGWFTARGFETREAARINEGQGDFLAAGGWLLAGSGFRTDPRAHAEAEGYFGRPVISLTLVNESYYHLDTALSVLDEQTIMYYPAAFGLNGVCDGQHVLMPAGAPGLMAQLRDRGYDAIDIEVSELLRAGGGVKCCTLELGPARERAAGTASGVTVVVTSVASDSHTWNLVYLQLVLEELGHQVVNLGACVPDELLVTECLRIRPHLVVVSTVNGHGFHDGLRLISRIRDYAELAEMPVVIGGKLGIAGPAGQEGREQLRAAGFDVVFEEGAAITALTSMAGQLTAGVRT
jgi:N-dimethylarginine dimethylaminohydrolase